MIRKLKLLIFFVLLFGFLAAINWTIQVYRNPAILISMFAGDSYKSSRSTWNAYGHLFEKHATATMTPKFLAALAQVESAGNPLIIPQWKWRFTTDITRIYAPASTSAGLYQYTRPTFQDAKRFCIHHHQVQLKKPFPNLGGCWFNGFYSRFWPSHAIEMTSARLDYYVHRILARSRLSNTSLDNKHKLAAIIHLCGVGKGERFARNGFDFNTLPKCGSHSTSAYYSRIGKAKNRFGTYQKSFFQRFF